MSSTSRRSRRRGVEQRRRAARPGAVQDADARLDHGRVGRVEREGTLANGPTAWTTQAIASRRGATSWSISSTLTSSQSAPPAICRVRDPAHVGLAQLGVFRAVQAVAHGDHDVLHAALAEVVGLDDPVRHGQQLLPVRRGHLHRGAAVGHRAHAHAFALHDARAVDVLADDVERRAVLPGDHSWVPPLASPDAARSRPAWSRPRKVLPQALWWRRALSPTVGGRSSMVSSSP